jgi:CBS domain-containing protein
MKCSEIMKHEVECCDINDSAADVAERMRVRHIGFLPVCDHDGCIIGTITDRDLAIRVVAERRDPDATDMREVMTPEAICCSPHDDLRTAEQLMSRHKKSRIVCVDGMNRPIGVISLSDVADHDRVEASAVLRAVAQREIRP